MICWDDGGDFVERYCNLIPVNLTPERARELHHIHENHPVHQCTGRG